MATERVKCAICDSMILPATSQANGGLCAQCVKIPVERRAIAAAVHAEPDPLGRALAMYMSLIDFLAVTCAGQNFGVLTDPEITVARFYTLETVSNLHAYDTASEMGAEVVDDIDAYLQAARSDDSLLIPIATKLRSISPAFNAVGKTVFFNSYGMSMEEIAWLIRYLNDRPTFERFFHASGLTLAQVDVYNDSYGRELT